MLRPSDNRVCNRRAGLEIHIRHPHWDKIESPHRRSRLKSPDPLSGGIHRGGILSPPVNNRRKIVLHSFSVSTQNSNYSPMHTAAAHFSVYSIHKNKVSATLQDITSAIVSYPEGF